MEAEDHSTALDIFLNIKDSSNIMQDPSQYQSLLRLIILTSSLTQQNPILKDSIENLFLVLEHSKAPYEEQFKVAKQLFELYVNSLDFE